MQKIVLNMEICQEIFFERPGITVLNERNHLKDEVYDIFQIMKKYDRYLATGHLSKDEIILLCLEGRRLNVKMILTHPEWKRTVIDIETQKYLASLGVLIEKNWLNIAEGDVLAKDMCEGIREIGVENIYLATDRGQKGFERPIYGMMKFIEVLLENGFKKEEIKVMTERNPKLIVGQK